MLMRLWFSSTVIAGCFVAGSVPTCFNPQSLAWADEDDDDEDDAVHELMEKTHEGKKSPWKKAGQAINATPIDWAEVDAAIPKFEKMSAALAEAKDADVRGSADGYIDAVKDLAIKSKQRNIAGTRDALKLLSQSCGDCHYKGGPGGKLDD